MKPSILVLLLVLWSIMACSPSVSSQFEGTASYYSESLDGKKTASGGTYKHWGLTAAHRKLEFGTRLRVTNIDNGRQVVVVVNDRGPYAKNRVIDLSGGAARKLDMLKSGVANVLVEVLE